MEKKTIKTNLVIIGAGPAGISAGIYAARAGLSPVILDDGIVGGQVSQSSVVENYPGFEKISGKELAENFRKHLSALGTEIEEFDSIERVEFSGDIKRIITESRIYEPKAVIIATGASPRSLPLENADKFAGRGIHYCALCDGSAYKGKTVGVVGGGSAAVEEALYLSNIAERVVMIRRKDSFHAEKALVKRAEAASNIEIRYNTDLAEIGGGDRLEFAVIKEMSGSEAEGRTERIPLSAIFVYIGSEPRTELFRESIHLDASGYIPADEDMRTSVGGVFAAGDVRTKRYRQIVTAVSDGAVAALNAEKYISALQR